MNNEFAMHAATRAGSVLFAPPPCAKGTATVKFFTMDNIKLTFINEQDDKKLIKKNISRSAALSPLHS